MGADSWALLRAGVPLTLLLDLADPAGPDSVAILAAEGLARSDEYGIDVPVTVVAEEAAGQ